MHVEQLIARRRELRDAARAKLAEIKNGMSEKEATRLEKEHDALMREYDQVQDALEDQRLAAEQAVEARLARRPGYEPGEARVGQQDAADVATGLMPEQRMADWARTEHADEAETYRGLSCGRFLRAMVLGGQTDLERRALAEGTDSAGGHTVPTVLSAELIDLMRAASVVSRAGARTIPLTSDNAVIAKVATDPTPAWRDENAAIAESEPTFAAVTLVPRSLAVLVKVSRELLEDSLNLGTELPRILTAALAQEWDRVALIGTGTAPQPRGIANQSGILTTALSGALTSFAPLVTARTKLLTANHSPNAIIAHPRDEGTLSGLTATDGQPLMAPRQIADLPMLTTTQIAVDGGAGTDESTIFMGDFTKVVLGLRSQIRVEILRETFAGNHQYGFVCHMRGDVAVSHAAAFHTTTAVVG